MKTIRASEVKRGDRIFNSVAYKSKMPTAFHWCNVISVKKIDKKTISITTFAFETLKHPEEGVVIQ